MLWLINDLLIDTVCNFLAYIFCIISIRVGTCNVCGWGNESSEHTEHRSPPSSIVIPFFATSRQSDSTPVHKALKLVVNARSRDTPHHGWNRPAGRPRTSWISQIVQDTRLTAADAWTVADDQSTWRVLRPTFGYAQQWVTVWGSQLCMRDIWANQVLASFTKHRDIGSVIWYFCISSRAP